MKNVADTRSRILTAAAGLFNTAGIRGATLDAIAASAGVTKKTIYHHFRSKDDLVAASLSRKNLADEATMNVAESVSLHDFVGRLFADITRYAADPHWQGCSFIRAAFELAGMPGHPGVIAAKSHKSRLERTFFQQLHSVDIVEARTLARRLILLLDGAITHSVIYHDPEYAAEAGRLAAELISAAKAKARARLKPMAPSAQWSERSPGGSDGSTLQLAS